MAAVTTLLLAANLLLTATSGINVVYVDSSTETDEHVCLDSSTNDQIPCLTLAYALSGISSRSGDDVETLLLVSSGEYTLPDHIQFNGTQGFVMSGHGTESTTIACNRSHDAVNGVVGGGISFSGCENVSISDLAFTGCGRQSITEFTESVDEGSSILPTISFRLQGCEPK